MELIYNEISRAFGYLFIAGLLYIAWKLAYDNSKGKKFWITLLKGFLWCIGIAIFTSITLGNPACEERSDPVYGGCERYADNGFEPTTTQRIANFIYYMVLLFPPVVLGIYAGSKNNKEINL